jgi:hypothetical protein
VERGIAEGHDRRARVRRVVVWDPLVAQEAADTRRVVNVLMKGLGDAARRLSDSFHLKPTRVIFSIDW